MKYTEFKPEFVIFKAGVIPYIIENDQIKMLFVISSNVWFGGKQPGIAKGGAEANEKPIETAMRECEEEIGLTKENFSSIIEGAKEFIQGEASSYPFYVYAAKLESVPQIRLSDEIGAVTWLTMEEFRQIGRKSQLGVVEKTYNKILNQNKSILQRLFSKKK
jgi:8-oxo-dGTP pyrophosphatase MutT (NUDIX family)